MDNRFEHFSLSIFRISHYWSKIATEEMKKHGLKGAYAIYLVTLLNYDGEMTSAKLAELCQRDKADVSRAITTFYEQGLLERPVSNNYRAVLKLSDKGITIARQVNARADLAIQLASKGVSDAMRADMYESLDIISDNLKEISKAGLPE